MTQEAFGLQDNSGGESAEKTRRAINFMLQRGASIGSVLGGLVAATDLQVTYQGAGLKIEVGQGEAIVPGNVSVTQSGYYFRNTAAATFTLTAANGSNPRIERVSLVVKDQSYEGSENLGEIKVSEGTAKAGATLTNLEGVAAAPKNSLTLGYVLVPAGATTISNSDIKNVGANVQLGVGGAGAWTPLTSISAEIEQAGFSQTVGARIEGTAVRLRGAFEVKTGKSLPVDTVFAVLPAGLRPPGQCLFTMITGTGASPGVNNLTITTAGELINFNKEVAANGYLPLDGITFNLT